MRRRSWRVWAGPGLLLLTAIRAAAVESPPAPSRLTFGGDLRLRHDSQFNKSAGQTDRHRERFRLRFGAQAEMERWQVGLRFASGTGDQLSANQTFGNAWNQKKIYIDQAYAAFRPLPALKLIGGKMENPFWRTASSELVWDPDLMPEGFAQAVDIPVGSVMSLFANLAQLPINEINSGSAAQRDPWMFGNQVGIRAKPAAGWTWDLAAASYSLSHETANVLQSTSSIDSSIIQGDNTRVPGQGALLAGQFHMLHLTTQLGFQCGLPVRLSGDWVANIHPDRPNGADRGYQAGAIINGAKKAGTWEAAYFYRYLEANATLSDFTESDFGSGGTNRKGHIVWVAYAPQDFLIIQAKYTLSKRVDPFVQTSAPFAGTAAPLSQDINRLQLDLIIKF